MYPRQDPKKMLAAKQPQEQEPGMDFGEAAILMLSVVAVLLLVGGLMVRFLPTLRFSGPTNGAGCLALSNSGGPR